MKIKITLFKVVIAMAFFLIWFNLPLYSSADNLCSSDSQVMFRLYSATNAHIEKVLPIKNYYTDVCYDSLFGISYNQSNPTLCTGSNKLLNIYSQTNAHAEDPTLSNYNESVCYGDLNCRLTTSSCNANESEVVSLSSQTNAHLSAIKDYPYHLCCSSNFALTNANQTNQTDTTPPVLSNITTIPTLPLVTNNSQVPFAISFDSSEFPVFVSLITTDSLNNTLASTPQIQINSSSDLPLLVSTPAGLSDGQYNIFLGASDNSSNRASFFVGNFIVNQSGIVPPPISSNNTAPIITVHSPVAGTYTINQILINISAINASSIWYSLNGMANATYSSPITLTFPEGNNLLSVFAVNSFGNQSNVNVLLTVNTTNGGGDGGGSGGGGSGSSGKSKSNRDNSLNPEDETIAPPVQFLDGEESSTSASKKRQATYNPALLWLISSLLLLLILVLLILLILAKRKNE